MNTKSKNKLNVKLLRKVQKHILEEPRRLKMTTWKSRSDEAPCGTVACIAGWATILGGKKTLPYATPGSPEGDRLRTVAQKLLGLSTEQTNNLFCSLYWPKKFKAGNDAASTCLKKARIASERIDHFIKTKGAE